MSYVITLTNRIDVGTDTSFKCILSDTISIKRNSFLKVQSAYLEKPNLAATSSGIYVCIKEGPDLRMDPSAQRLLELFVVQLVELLHTGAGVLPALSAALRLAAAPSSCSTRRQPAWPRCSTPRLGEGCRFLSRRFWQILLCG